ncbi:flagellar motor protein MotB [Rhodocaloribacter litoris]|uniref:OmpA/MotB family protein n=1 Tax=Rhodocaloribacter litoris TaxID=2558931 RepID=UPI0014238087|nr:flagellar motor protein MotB [Rhodocaloribacter litoris]QXD16060.1 flagellar motor protein MotB [Rhodocaloribacter litoris]GIV59791.1 MAG: membrane protein [Rhodothermaceae bacterium]
MPEPMQPEPESDEPSAPFWMTTFSDMATLLLTFFVMIVAMSEVEVKKFQEALSYFQGRTSILSHDAVIPPPTKQIITQPEKARELVEKYEMVMKYLVEHGLQDKVQVNLREEGVHVLISDSVMFRSGEAEIIEPSRSLLRLIAGILSEDITEVLVEGHTDNRPIHTSQYPSNWELSAARAAAVVRFLLEQNSALDPERYAAVGYGEYQPLASNETAAGRAKNRRVEILFSIEPWQKKSASKTLLPEPKKIP